MHDDSMWLKLLLGPTAYNSQKYTPKTFWTSSAVLATRSNAETKFLWSNRNSSADSKRGKLLLQFKNQLKVGPVKQFSVSFFFFYQVNDHKDKASHGFLSALRRAHHWYWYKSITRQYSLFVLYSSQTLTKYLLSSLFIILLKDSVVLCLP